MTESYKNHKDFYTAIDWENQSKINVKAAYKSEKSAPFKYSFDLKNIDKLLQTEATTAKRPVYDRNSVTTTTTTSTTTTTAQPTTTKTVKTTRATVRTTKKPTRLTTPVPFFMPTITDEMFMEKELLSATKEPKRSKVVAKPSTTHKPNKLLVTGEMKDLLKTIGVKAPDEMTNGKVSDETDDQSLFEMDFQLPDNLNLVSALTGNGADSPPSISSQNTFGNVESNLKKAMDNLTPDIKQMFSKFGISATTSTTTTTTTTPKPFKPVAGTSQFNNFKRLPNNPVENKDMRDFLAKFGLGSETRVKKAMNSNDNKPRQQVILNNFMFLF